MAKTVVEEAGHGLAAPGSRSPQDPPRAFAVRLGVANFGLYAALLTPVVVTMALRVAQVDPVHKASSLSLVLGVGALLAMFGNPLVGRLSDRTTSRFGRRRPWLIGGVLVGTLGLALIALVPSIPVILLGWCLTQLAYNASYSALTATIADQLPEERQGSASGAIGTSITAAVLLGATLAASFSDLRVAILLPCVLAIATITWFALTLPDKPLTTTPPPFSVREFLGSFWVNPLKHRPFGWAWITKFTVQLGQFTPSTYLAYFVSDRLHVTSGDLAAKVAGLVTVSYAVNAVTAAAGGWISDRFGRRKPFIIGSGLGLALGLVLLATAHTYTGVLVAQLVLGVAGGLFYAVDLALVMQVLPDRESAAKDLGVINIANALPQSIAPAVAPFILVIGMKAGQNNYTLLFLCAAVCAALGSVLVSRIRGVR